jgi:ribosomal protein L11 methyltransferase
MGALSVTFSDAEDEPILELGPGETQLWSNTCVTALFPGDRDPDGVRTELGQALNKDICRNLQLELLKDQEWERNWMSHYQPMRFGKRLWVCPKEAAVDEDNAVVVFLDPGLAFGTGTHPTTALCLTWLAKAKLRNKTVIDFGCGSGILAIAALKLGAAEAIGSDHDPQAILASRDNALSNGVSSKLTLVGPGETLTTKADILLANILSGTLIKLADQLTDLLLPGGDILLSGILPDQADQVAAAFAPNFHMEPAVIDRDWVLLHGKRMG